MKPSLALSTCWCSHRHNDGHAMLREIAALGFDYVELSHGIRITLVPGVLRAIDDGVIMAASTHNFCPLPTGILQAAPNLFEPSALDHQEHDQWIRHTRRSIDFAAQVRARVLVCHLGAVSFFWFNPGRNLHRYLHDHPDAGRAGVDETYRSLLEKSLARLRKRMTPYWDRTRASIGEVADYAAQKGIRLGFENRERFEELPLDSDHLALLDGLPANLPAGYWHDTGHADIKEGIGLLNHRAHLEKMVGRTIGFHLHDVNSHGKDHQPVGDGHIDFEMVSGFWREDQLLTIELSPHVTPEEVLASRKRVEALIRKRFG